MTEDGWFFAISGEMRSHAGDSILGSANPNGIESISPGVARNELPWDNHQVNPKPLQKSLQKAGFLKVGRMG